ncbi:terminase small subunit, partial [Clostridium tertium]
MAKPTDKQMIFANEYLIDLNATRAYKKAYPNVKKDSVAKAAASRLLTNVNLKNYIDEQLKKIEDESIADATEVMKYLTAVMRNELTEEVVVVEGEGEGCSSARIVKKDISAKDRNKAAE